MGKRIVVVGAGAVGGYTGGHMSRAGHDVTLIDAWPEHVEYMRSHGLQLSGLTEAERHSVRVNAWHVCDVQNLAKQKPVDIAFICVKSYDTEWAAHLIKPYLGAEAVRVGQALGYQLEKMVGMDAETLARAGEGNNDALVEITDILIEGAKKRSDEQRPSMAQDITKGRRTETDFINGYVAVSGAEIGVPAPTHVRMNELVKHVERREIKASPDNIAGW